MKAVRWLLNVLAKNTNVNEILKKIHLLPIMKPSRNVTLHTEIGSHYANALQRILIDGSPSVSVYVIKMYCI